MAEYNFSEVEQKWQAYWKKNSTFKTKEISEKPKYYVLDMFPYPSGAGLHVGHPLGYIATDIVARYKRLKGFNVLHPMGFDSFGLPAEQYAIKTGQHPKVTTDTNIKRFKEQLNVLGFSYDWDKELRTSDPSYYKWTQWIFLKLFNSYFDLAEKKAKPISELPIPEGLSKKERRAFIDDHRLAYQDEIAVNWCPALGTVLANEEVIGGVSERGGFPVIRKPMKQWMMRITAYCDRLLDELEDVDWPESIRLSQKNWIGKSLGAEIIFKTVDGTNEVRVFSTRPDTIFGATYVVLAPEHPLVDTITTSEHKESVDAYKDAASKKSDLERQELDKSKTGVFTGGYVINPMTGEQVPAWISDYVLISYGTGAIMAVPAHDERDFEFATKFGLPIKQVISEDGQEKPELKEALSGHGVIINSGDHYNGLDSKEFIKIAIEQMEGDGTGKGAVNYKLRDWVFTRQRYWGEPIPVIHTEDGEVKGIPESELPLVLPEVDSYQPAEDGSSPLARNAEWVKTTDPETGRPALRETNTMPQWAGSCWYYLRYLQPDNDQQLGDPEAIKYWSPVDLYVGGAEHAVLHLLYARFWHKVLFDLGYVSHREPFQKLVNQGMIQGRSNFVYRIKDTNTFVSLGLKDQYEVTPIHVDVNLVDKDVLNVEAFKKSSHEYKTATFELEDGKYLCGAEVEKMSKSKLNVVSPDDIITRYGADTLRMYEMFLGPLEQNKPWNTNGIDGVFKFIRKFWRLFHEDDAFSVSDDKPTAQEMKILHKAIKKTQDDIERLSLNTSVSGFMITVNELSSLKCNKRAVLEPLTIMISPFAPHLAEELWSLLGHEESISEAEMPAYDEQYLKEDAFEYPVMINGKLRTKMTFAADVPNSEIQTAVLASEIVMKWTEGKAPKKVIIVPKKIVNIVV